MRILIVALPVLLAIAGCGPSQDQIYSMQLDAAAYEAKRECANPSQHPHEVAKCERAFISYRMAQLEADRLQNQQANAQALSRSLLSAGAVLAAAAPPPPQPMPMPQPVNCTSRSSGGTVYTNCR